MEWALGNVDEAMFVVSTSLQGLKKKPIALSDRAEFDRLAGSALAEVGPEKLFLAPPAPSVTLTPTQLPPTAWMPGPNRYRAFRLEYATAVPTGQPNNDRVSGFYLERIGAEKAPTVIYLHGWLEFDAGLALRLPLSWFGPLGCNILALHLPFHFGRAAKGSFSGELSITANLPLAIKGLQQAVSDVRQARHWLQHERGIERIGIVGKSLGGLVEAVTLAADDGFTAGVLAVPATSTRSTLWKSRYTSLIRRDLTRQGLDEETTARVLEIIRPGRYRPLIDPARLLLIKARADRVCFPPDTDSFALGWGLPVVEIPTGHLTATIYPRMRQASQEHLRRFLFEVQPDSTSLLD